MGDKIDEQTSTEPYDSHVSCMDNTPGGFKILFVGSMNKIRGKAIPKDEPVLVYSCPCKECMKAMDYFGIF